MSELVFKEGTWGEEHMPRELELTVKVRLTADLDAIKSGMFMTTQGAEFNDSENNEMGDINPTLGGGLTLTLSRLGFHVYHLDPMELFTAFAKALNRVPDRPAPCSWKE